MFSSPSGTGRASSLRCMSHGEISAWSWLPATTTISASGSALPSCSKNGRATASASRGGPWRSSSVSPSSTTRSATDAASSSRARTCGRESRSVRDALPRCRSETISVRIVSLAARARVRIPPRARPTRSARLARGGRRLADRLGKHEANILAHDVELDHVSYAACAEERDQLLDEVLGRACAGGDADDALALEPLLAHLARVVDEMRLGTAVARDLDEAHRVGGVGGADH